MRCKCSTFHATCETGRVLREIMGRRYHELLRANQDKDTKQQAYERAEQEYRAHVKGVILHAS